VHQPCVDAAGRSALGPIPQQRIQFRDRRAKSVERGTLLVGVELEEVIDDETVNSAGAGESVEIFPCACGCRSRTDPGRELAAMNCERSFLVISIAAVFSNSGSVPKLISDQSLVHARPDRQTWWNVISRAASSSGAAPATTDSLPTATAVSGAPAPRRTYASLRCHLQTDPTARPPPRSGWGSLAIATA